MTDGWRRTDLAAATVQAGETLLEKAVAGLAASCLTFAAARLKVG